MLHSQIVICVITNHQIIDMKNYMPNSVLTFGKYQGKMISEVAASNHGCIDWCLIHLDHFYISQNTLDSLLEAHSDFSLSSEALIERKEKELRYLEVNEQIIQYQEVYNYNSTSDDEMETFLALTDGEDYHYDEWRDNGGDIDTLMMGMGF